MDSQAFWAEAERYRTLARSPLTRGKAKRKLAELCRAHDGDLTTKTEVAGLPITLDLKQGADRAIYLFGTGDPRGIALIEKIMGRLDCRTAWDVGANRGNHAAFMRGRCRRLFAFEPNPFEHARLAALFEGDPAVTALQMGLSDRAGELPFLIDPENTGGATFELEGRTPNAVSPVRTGDDVAAEHGVDDLDFAKIDVEGHEAHTLAGMAGLIARCRPVIVMELLEAQNTPALGLPTLLPDYALYGNRTGLRSGITMGAYDLGPFEHGRTYMAMLCCPREKLDRFSGLVPRG